MNVFVKPKADELARMLRRENGTSKRNVFDNPNDQWKLAYIGMERKRGCEKTKQNR